MAKPAVLVVMDWKKDTCSLSNNDKLPIVKGLLYSKMNINNPPAKISIRDVIIAILLCKVSFRKDFKPDFLNSLLIRITSHQTT